MRYLFMIVVAMIPFIPLTADADVIARNKPFAPVSGSIGIYNSGIVNGSIIIGAENDFRCVNTSKAAYLSCKYTEVSLKLSDSDDFIESRRHYFERFSRHQLLGYAALGMAGLAVVTSSSKSIHYFSAYSAAGLGVATCVDGLMQYGDRLRGGGASGLYKSHAALGMIGAAGCVAACVLADSDGGGSHASVGVAGGSLMVLSYTLLVW